MTIIANPSPPYVYQEFPKWKYHPDKEPLIVADYEAEKALGQDWYDTPREAQDALHNVREKLIKEGVITPNDRQ